MVKITRARQTTTQQTQALDAPQKAKATATQTGKAASTVQPQGGHVDPTVAKEFAQSAGSQKAGAPGLNIRLESMTGGTDIRSRLKAGHQP